MTDATAEPTHRTDPHDGRGVLVVMTTRGTEAVDDAISELLADEAELLEGLSKADQERLAGLLRKLVNSVEGELKRRDAADVA